MTVPFSTQSPGIGGSIKQRYADFIVEEIQLDGSKRRAERFLKEDGFKSPSLIELPEKPGDRKFSQLHCDLEKVNCDTNNAISRLSRSIGCSKKRVGYAGLKDKRAITCQRISLFNPDLERLRQFHSPVLDLRNFEWKQERIEIGNLKRNAFTIIIRNIDGEKNEIHIKLEKLLKEIGSNGVANYFGEQRFGGIRNVTHLVGKAMIKGNLEEAVFLYLTHASEKEPEALKNARKQLAEQKDFAAALHAFPQENRFEKAMLNHLVKYPNDFAGAFSQLPKPMRYLFTHAYQSFLFNQIIAERISQGIGLQAQPEDVLMDGIPTAPLFGFETKFCDGKIGQIEKKTLENEGVSLTEFRVLQMPEVSSAGSRKKIVLYPQQTNILAIEQDELNPGKNKAMLYFELEKGSYATTVLNEIQKN